jgi:pimeloyl-ACP methyl ester carboxylesterase
VRLADLPPVAGVRHRHVDLADVRLHVAEAGEGPPLVLLHGWPQHWWCWRHLMPPLAQSYRVIAPDLRGFGWSEAPPGDYSKATFANDIVALLDAEGLDRVRLLAHDWGAFSSFLLALEHPERVERLVALDVAPPWSTRSTPRPRHLGLPLFLSYQFVLATPVLGQAALTQTTRFVREVIDAGSGPDAEWAKEELDAYAAVLRDPARARASSACYRTFLTREVAAMGTRGDRSGELQPPTLLAMGGASPLRRVLDPQPGGRVRVETVERAGHFLPEEAPDAVLKLATEWFAG